MIVYKYLTVDHNTSNSDQLQEITIHKTEVSL